MPNFQELGLKGNLVAGLAAMQITAPTTIQQLAVPPILAGRDLLGQAPSPKGGGVLSCMRYAWP